MLVPPLGDRRAQDLCVEVQWVRSMENLDKGLQTGCSVASFWADQNLDLLLHSGLVLLAGLALCLAERCRGGDERWWVPGWGTHHRKVNLHDGRSGSWRLSELYSGEQKFCLREIEMSGTPAETEDRNSWDLLAQQRQSERIRRATEVTQTDKKDRCKVCQLFTTWKWV